MSSTLFAVISQNLQLDKNEMITFWGQKLKGERHSKILRWRHTNPQFAIEDHLV